MHNLFLKKRPKSKLYLYPKAHLYIEYKYIPPVISTYIYKNLKYKIRYLFKTKKEAESLKFKEIGVINNIIIYALPVYIINIGIEILAGIVYSNEKYIPNKLKIKYNNIWLKKNLLCNLNDLEIWKESHSYIMNKYSLPKVICSVSVNGVSYLVRYIFKNKQEARNLFFWKKGVTDDNKYIVYILPVYIKNIGNKILVGIVPLETS